MNEIEFCPKCGNKTFEYTGSCSKKFRCTRQECRYFLYVDDFIELKKKKKEEGKEWGPEK